MLTWQQVIENNGIENNDPMQGWDEIDKEARAKETVRNIFQAQKELERTNGKLMTTMALKNMLGLMKYYRRNPYIVSHIANHHLDLPVEVWHSVARFQATAKDIPEIQNLVNQILPLIKPQ